MDLCVPLDLAGEIEAIQEAEVARGVRTTENKVAIQLIRWGLITARELGRLPNKVAFE